MMQILVGFNFKNAQWLKEFKNNHENAGVFWKNQ